MTSTKAVAAVAASALVAACAAAPDPEPAPSPIRGACRADPAQFGLGQTYTDALGARMKAASGAKLLRVTRPGDVVTMDFSADRLGIELDAQGLVARARCG